MLRDRGAQEVNKKRYSPSSLQRFVEYCPKALDFHQERVWTSKHNAWVGNTFHYIIEKAIRETQTQGRLLNEAEINNLVFDVSNELKMIGKPGDNEPLPVLSVDEGADLAKKYLLSNTPSPEVSSEIGVSYDKNWQITEWDSGLARFRLVFDHFQKLEGEGEYGEIITTLEVKDFKTGWSVNEAHLDSIQMMGQTIAAYDMAKLDPEIHLLVVQVYNVRKNELYSKEYWIGEDSEVEIEEMRSRLKNIMDLADALLSANFERPARVGHYCPKCPYASRCPAIKAALAAEEVPEDPVEVFRTLLAANAIAAKMESHLKAMLTDGGIVQDGPVQIGYHAVERREISREASKRIYENWESEGGEPRGFLDAIGGLALAQVDKIAKKMHPRKKAAQKEFLNAHVSTKTGCSWSIKNLGSETKTKTKTKK